jgi:hypothetical protein
MPQVADVAIKAWGIRNGSNSMKTNLGEQLVTQW